MEHLELRDLYIKALYSLSKVIAQLKLKEEFFTFGIPSGIVAALMGAT